ncbi:hypothetical protein EHS25_006094 [Saitozyma podzolica]|uniref:Uncharacterized protein n=1 Tax=Saitozyma podzolica TaxID=1890683 RepID=A0A427XTV0_9TREE|nr:hypothetical protein EHS25_006094 [Saitozyma podzolica]
MGARPVAAAAPGAERPPDNQAANQSRPAHGPERAAQRQLRLALETNEALLIANTALEQRIRDICEQFPDVTGPLHVHGVVISAYQRFATHVDVTSIFPLVEIRGWLAQSKQYSLRIGARSRRAGSYLAGLPQDHELSQASVYPGPVTGPGHIPISQVTAPYALADLNAAAASSAANTNAPVPASLETREGFSIPIVPEMKSRNSAKSKGKARCPNPAEEPERTLRHKRSKLSE